MSELSVTEVLKKLSGSIPWDRAADWDVSGLTIGDANQPVRTAGVCHEVNNQVLEVLKQAPVDLLVTYHPLLFRPVRRLLAGRSPAGLAFRLIETGTALAVAHTAFDACPGGVADALADSLGLLDTIGFGPMETADQIKVVTFVPAPQTEEVAQALAAAGGGRIGNYRGCSYRSEGTGAFLPESGAAPVVGAVAEENRVPEVRLEMIAAASVRDKVVAALVSAHPYEEPAFDLYPVSANLPMAGRIGTLPTVALMSELAEKVARVLGVTGVRLMGADDQPVQKVAVLPGSGGSFLTAAGALGAQVVVTGDVSHHQMNQARHQGMGVIDPGHAATEAPGVRRLLRLVEQVVANTVDLTRIRPGPTMRVRRRTA